MSFYNPLEIFFMLITFNDKEMIVLCYCKIKKEVSHIIIELLQ